MLTNDVFAEVHWSHFFILKFGVLVILFFTNRFTIMMFKNVKWSCFSSISTNKASNHCRQTFGRCDNKTTLFTKQNKYYKRLYYYTIRLQQTNRLFWLWTTNSSLDEDLIDLWWTLNNPAHPCTPNKTQQQSGTMEQSRAICCNVSFKPPLYLTPTVAVLPFRPMRKISAAQPVRSEIQPPGSSWRDSELTKSLSPYF